MSVISVLLGTNPRSGFWSQQVGFLPTTLSIYINQLVARYPVTGGIKQTPILTNREPADFVTCKTHGQHTMMGPAPQLPMLLLSTTFALLGFAVGPSQGFDYSTGTLPQAVTINGNSLDSVYSDILVHCSLRTEQWHHHGNAKEGSTSMVHQLWRLRAANQLVTADESAGASPGRRWDD
jgi:hypothetical protein